MLDGLASLATRRPRRVVAVAVALAFAAAAIGGSVAERLYPYSARDPATESVQATDALQRATGLDPSVGIVALVDTPSGVRSPTGRAAVARVARVLRSERTVGRVQTYFDTRDRAMVSRNRRATYVVAQFRALKDKVEQEGADRLVERLKNVPGVTLGGAAVANAQVNETVSEDLKRAELLAFPLLFLLSLWFFRSAVSAILPPLVGGLSIVGTFLALRVASEFGEVSVFALNLVTGLGLGLAIDYSLLMVTRYREEIARTGPGPEALKRTLATSGRTVLFSSATVAAAAASLLVFPQRFLYSMGLGGTIVVLVAATVALVVLPAVLALLGERVNALAPRWLHRAAERDARPDASGGWYRLSRFVMRRPVLVALVTGALLLALGSPFLGIKFTSVDASVLPADKSAHVTDSRLDREFPPHRSSPVYLAVAGPADVKTEAFAAELRRQPGVAAVAAPEPTGRASSAIRVVSSTRALADSSQELVRHLRAVPAPYGVKVGGETAAFVDTKSSLRSHIPVAFAIIAVATVIALFLMTGSVVLPLKALVMNVLTLSATFGILVLVFQDGRLEGLLDYRSQGALETSQPVVLFALAFGLSTDYGVFLLSRIKEARDAGAAESESVAIGLERTGRIVTAAALLFCVAIGAFATSRVIFIKEVGIGTALAVLIDATLVRALLVPSLMELLGRRNWWAPGPLRRLHARFGLREEPAAAKP